MHFYWRLWISDFVITNPPRDTTVCLNDMAECTCGFVGADPSQAIPDWIIVKRAADGSLMSNRTINGREIFANRHNGFSWQFGQITPTSAPNSRLVFGPVDQTHNQSSYQCVSTLTQIVNGLLQIQTVRSSVGALTVVGKRFSLYYYIGLQQTYFSYYRPTIDW